MAYNTFDVEVPGGTIHVGQWGAGPAVVLAAHGVTGTHMNFEALADQLGRFGDLAGARFARQGTQHCERAVRDDPACRGPDLRS